MYANEQQLLEDLRKGEEKAYRYLFDHHFQQLCLVAMTYLHDRQEAEAVVVDCIFHFWEKREKVMPGFPLRRYLAFMVRNRCFDKIRSEQVRQRVYNEYASELELCDEEERRSELSDMIIAAIDRLPKECRQVMRWSRLEGLHREEIAERLDISVNTVKYHLKHGMELLRKDLANKLIALFIAYTSFNATPLPFLPPGNVINTETQNDYGSSR